MFTGREAFGLEKRTSDACRCVFLWTIKKLTQIMQEKTMRCFGFLVDFREFLQV
jgi:hypothetical protein